MKGKNVRRFLAIVLAFDIRPHKLWAEQERCRKAGRGYSTTAWTGISEKSSQSQNVRRRKTHGCYSYDIGNAAKGYAYG